MLKDNLAMLRRIRGFSQEELAEMIGISRQAYAKWESGATIPDVEKCARLAEVYGTTVDSLIRTVALDRMGTIPPAPRGKNIWGTVAINDRGQRVIPKGARERFGLTGGQRLVVVGDETGIALIPADVFEEKMRQAIELIQNSD